MTTNLSFDCQDKGLVEEVKKKINGYMAHDPELNGRGSQQYTVHIRGNRVPAPKDLAREIAESVLFECGNLMQRREYRYYEANLGKTFTVNQVGKEKSTVEALQMYKWGLGLRRCRVAGMELSDYGNNQVTAIETNSGTTDADRVEKFVDHFNTGSHGIGKTNVHAYIESGEIYVKIKPVGQVPVAEPPLTSEEMYAYNTLKDIKTYPARFQKLIGGLVDEPLYNALAKELNNCILHEDEYVTMYCTMLNVIARTTRWKLAHHRKLVLPTLAMKKYARWDNKVANFLNRNTQDWVDKHLYPILDNLPQSVAVRAKECFRVCPFD